MFLNDYNKFNKKCISYINIETLFKNHTLCTHYIIIKNLCSDRRLTQRTRDILNISKCIVRNNNKQSTINNQQSTINYNIPSFFLEQ